jgi:hypothetical protein
MLVSLFLVCLEKQKRRKKKGIISLTPSNFSHFCKHPPNIQKLSLTLELSKILTYPHPYKLGHILKKRPKYPCFLFKIKNKKNIWKLEFYTKVTV